MSEETLSAMSEEPKRARRHAPSARAHRRWPWITGGIGLVVVGAAISGEHALTGRDDEPPSVPQTWHSGFPRTWHSDCLLYTSDAADEEDSVDLGGRRIIK